MKIIFFGSSDFAVPILEKLSETEVVPLIVTQPDRKKGRDLKVSYTAVKECALRLGIKIFQPPEINSKDAVDYLKTFNADMFIVVSFGQILSEEVLKIPKLSCINVHASLLPKYRGAAPINRAIYNGEKETGITIMKMNKKMDEGDIILQNKIDIGDHDDAVRLSKMLSDKGVQALKEAIELINADKFNFLKQDASKATYAPKLKKEHGLINWDKPAQEIYNKVRAFVPWPGCFTYLGNKVIKIWKASILDSNAGNDAKPGTIANVNKDGIIVNTGKGSIIILELQAEGKRRMQVKEFIAGHREISVGTVLGNKNKK